MTTLKMHTPNLVDSNIERLAALFPNCVTEKPKTDEQGKVIRDMNGEVVLERGIDFELLKQELSHSVIDGSQERYRLDWVGKREAIVTANSPIAKTLRPCRDESVDFETTGNLFIEGDNIEALKLLQESYLGKVKMIYIDPPYNTGNDFIYNDDFAADTAEFFERSGQVDGDGNRLVANTESNGRFHSDWLSMMYSRLKLARNLLSDDGVIFISIDENEVDNLKKIGSEIFGSSNFIGNIAVVNNPKGRSDQKNLATAHEYLLSFQKTDLASFKGFKAEEHITKRYNKEDEKGLWREIDLRKTGDNDRAEDRPNMFYPFYWNEKQNLLGLEQFSSEDIEIYPMKSINEKGCWRWGKNTAQSKLENLYSRYMPNKQQWSVFEKDYFDENDLIKSTTIWNFKDVNSERGTDSFVKDLEFVKKVFTSPKPIGTIFRALLLATEKNSIVLDFFAGSSTTAHAVMQLNAEDGGNRKFIMVQIPEATDSKSEAFKAGYPTIAEISKERIRRAGAKIKTDNADKDGINELDTGFRVLKIDTTNMNDIYYRPQDYSQDLLDQLQDNIKPDRTDEDLLFQFMLDTGVPLSLPIERTELSSKSGGHTIYQVGGNSLIASLDYIDANMVNDIAALNPLKFITSERAIATDSDKTNIKERFKQLSPHTDVRFI
ncbi:site-specific DNA-methyltransferase [Moraxella osloensis]|nr:site-specific DNA-methyltransferase [Moraxella osloensis]MBL7668739.1 site-specific DNA-methyltransferase [Moraxella osloensis]